jgi:hypothetical protein
MAYIIRGSSAPDLTFTRTAGDVALGRISAYRGVDQTTPLAAGSANTLGSNSATVTTSTLTPSKYGSLLVMAACGADNTNGSAYQGATAPVSGRWRERADSNTGTGADTFLAIADAVKGAAAATGTLQYTAGNSSRHVCIVGAFNPADGQDINTHALVDFLQEVTSGNPLSATTPSFTPADNSLLAVVFMGENDSGALNTGWSVSDSNGLTWTQRKAQHDGNGSGGYNSECEIWTAPVTSGAAGTVTVARSGINSGSDPGRINIQVLCLEGADNASPIGGSASGNSLNGTTGAMTLSSTPAATSITLAARAILQSGTDDTLATPGSGWLECIDQARSQGYGDLETQIRENSTSTSVAWTDVNDSNIGVNSGSPFGVAVEIKAGSTTIDASGDLAAQSASIDGAVDVIVGVDGSLEAQASSIDGAIQTALSVGGSLSAQAATIDATVSALISTDGTLAAQSSQIDGSISAIVSTVGNLTAQDAAISSQLDNIISADGSLQSDAASLDGNVDIGITLNISGNIVAQNSAIDALTSIYVSATSSLNSQPALIRGNLALEELPRPRKPMSVRIAHTNRPPGGFNTVFYVDDK